MTESQNPRDGELTRRRLLRGATVGGLALPVLVACGTDEPSTGSGSGAESSSGGSSSDSSSGSGSGGSGGTTVPVADVPVGGGTILKDEKLVVTQPSEGEFKAFDGTCTHQGCLVSQVTETIDCNCHGSKFSLSDGSPQSGPASSPLAAKTVQVDGNQLSIS
jgi:Rieske Fe-S protein